MSDNQGMLMLMRLLEVDLIAMVAANEMVKPQPVRGELGDEAEEENSH